MPIRNYTSTVRPSKSAGKIQELLAEHGAERVMMNYGADGHVTSIEFIIPVEGAYMGFRIASDPEGMLRAMEEDDDIRPGYCTIEQARRTVWKNKLDWLHAQLAEVAANQARLDELLLGSAITPDGDTVYRKLREEGHIMTSVSIPQLTP